MALRSQHRVTISLGTVAAADLEAWLKELPAHAQISASHSAGDRPGEPATYSLTAAWTNTENGQSAAPVSSQALMRGTYSGPDYSRGPDGGIRETSR